MSSEILIFINVIQIIILIILGLPVLYIFIYSLAGLFYRQPIYLKTTKHRKIAVLIPGYKEDDVIIEVAKEALIQDYPSYLFEVVIIADSFLPETIEALNKLPIKVIEVSFEKSTKSKALYKAMEILDNSYEIAVVLDADNLMAINFLTKINAFFERNYLAVQGHRVAKNMNTSLAILDAISEEINNHIFRRGHRVLRLPSSLIGSGMAFKYSFFKEIMSSAKAVGGFDKEIELKMAKNGNTIEYLDDAYVYDEKVQDAKVFTNQRRRWLSAQWHYFKQDFLSTLKELLHNGNVSYFDKAISLIQPPRILLLGAIFTFGPSFIIANSLLNNGLFYSVLWFIVIVACVFSFLFSIPTSFYNLNTVRALVSLPKGMFLMLVSLLNIRGANEKFIHTKHTSTSNIK